MRLLRGRWLWGVLGAIATTYLIRRSRSDGHYRVSNGTGRTVQSAVRTGRSFIGQTVKAALRRG